MLGVKDNTCSAIVYGEVGRYPVIVQHRVTLLKYWCNLVDLDSESLEKKAYNILKELSVTGFTTLTPKMTQPRRVLE